MTKRTVTGIVVRATLTNNREVVAVQSFEGATTILTVVDEMLRDLMGRRVIITIRWTDEKPFWRDKK